jgi:radical SAM superfamily enzyme YgiQ (UPF0313 family)
MKIILIQPDQIGMDFYKFSYLKTMLGKRKAKRILPLGLLYLATSLDCSIEFVDNYFLRLSNDKLANHCLKKIGSDKGIVGFGGTCLEWQQASQVSKLLKRDNIITVYGGPNATARPEKHVNYFDFVFRGIGIESFNQFVKGNNRESISGLCWKNHIVNPCFDLDFNKYKWPSIKILKDKNININYSNYSLESISSSIGCPFHCRFCAAKFIWNKSVFFREPDDVLDEVRYLKDTFNISKINFREDNFTINKDRLLYFCKELKKIKVNWKCQSRISSLNDELLSIMKDAGCVEISCGFESANDSMLSYIQKGHTVNDIKRVILLFEKHRIAYTGGFIVGFPTETKEEIINTCNFIKKIRKNKLCGVPKKPCRFLGIPTSELYNEIIKDNLIEYNWNDGELLFTKTKNLSSEEVDKLIENNT